MCWNKHIHTQITLDVISIIVNTFVELHCYLFTYLSILFSQQIIPIYQLWVVFIKIKIGFKKEVDLLSFIPLLFIFISSFLSSSCSHLFLVTLSFLFFFHIFLFSSSPASVSQTLSNVSLSFNVFSFSFILCILVTFLFSFSFLAFLLVCIFYFLIFFLLSLDWMQSCKTVFFYLMVKPTVEFNWFFFIQQRLLSSITFKCDILKIPMSNLINSLV